MPQDRTLVEDEARRLAQHEKVKARVIDEVESELLEGAEESRPVEHQRAAQVGRSLRREAIDEVGATDLEIRRSRAVARVSQVVDYLFFLVYALIGLQILLELIGAREGAGFKQLMNAITAPLLGPFRGLVADPGVGPAQFMFSYVVALIVYALLHQAVRGLLRVLASRRTTL